jgi:hypothetical protein
MIHILLTKYIVIDDYTTIIAGIGSVIATIFGSVITTYIIHLYQSSSQQQQYNNNNDHTKNENYDGLTCLLIGSAFLMMITTYCSEVAYRIANMVLYMLYI